MPRGRSAGVPHAREIEVKKKAFEAARLVLNNSELSMRPLAEQYGITRHAIGNAYLLLRYATAAEIDSVENGGFPLSDMTEVVRARETVRERKLPRQGDEYKARVALDAVIWSKLRDALDAINGLPQPSDVVNSVRRHAVRTNALNDKLISAYGWITEFSDAWTK